MEINLSNIRLKAEHGVVCRMDQSVFGYFGWPTVARAGNGRLVVASSGMRLFHLDLFGKTTLCFSENDGKTWSMPMVVNDTPLDDRDAGVVNIGGNKIILTWFAHDRRPYEKSTNDKYMHENLSEMEFELSSAALKGLTKEALDKYYGSWVRISEDNGITWGKPVNIHVTAPHGPILLKNGTLLYVGKEHLGQEESGEYGEGKIMVYRSNDCGNNWSCCGLIPIPEETMFSQFHEPHSIELIDGSILSFIRFVRRNTPNRWSFHYSMSFDQGKSWSVAQPTEIDGTPPHLMRHSSGAIVCTYSRRIKPYSHRVMISLNESKTWEADIILRDDAPDSDIGYPSSVELRDGSIMTVYYQRLYEHEKPSLLYTKWEIPNKRSLK